MLMTLVEWFVNGTDRMICIVFNDDDSGRRLWMRLLRTDTLMFCGGCTKTVKKVAPVVPWIWRPGTATSRSVLLVAVMFSIVVLIVMAGGGWWVMGHDADAATINTTTVVGVESIFS